ncbi:MAG: binding-protein-dependent transport system inner rane component [Naasia sp.]|jgi:D-methionine transport system permease protein|uniref:methionine ABC transporter permease n=1 Tax=Naasia sp. TaxID=2546198 RepID=UPI00260DA2B6|nr:methionine ABC transporter permease [Naasia sp.]MCU1569926.1 binding-protein-dependent transport system inner rane component [Naasia sp.]
MNTPWSDVPELLIPALGETLVMVGIVMLLIVLLGTPLGLVLHNTSPSGLFPNRGLYAAISSITNVGRSLPFLVLMAAVIPFTRFVVGTNIGVGAAIVPMTLAGIPFAARLVQNAIREVPREITAAGIAAGGSPVQIIRTVQLSEALPGLVGGFTINLIALIEYSAIAGAIGAGGLGYLAVNYGYQRFDGTIMLSCVVTLILAAQLLQFAGDRTVARLTRTAS